MRGRSDYVLSKGLGAVHSSGLELQIDRLAFRSEEICGGFRWFASISSQIGSEVVGLSNVWISGITGQLVLSSLFLVSEEFNVKGSVTLKLYVFFIYLNLVY